MTQQTIRPLDPPPPGQAWTPPSRRISDRFRVDWAAILADLEHEIDAAGASRYVLQIDVSESDLKVDGTLRARARPASPAVRVLFTAPRIGALSFASDRYERWQANIRAIGLTLNALRAVDRYNVTSGTEQYRGWLAIASAPADVKAEPMTLTRAAQILASPTWPYDVLAAAVRSGDPEPIRQAFFVLADQVSRGETAGDLAELVNVRNFLVDQVRAHA